VVLGCIALALVVSAGAAAGDPLAVSEYGVRFVGGMLPTNCGPGRQCSYADSAATPNLRFYDGANNNYVSACVPTTVGDFCAWNGTNFARSAPASGVIYWKFGTTWLTIVAALASRTSSQGTIVLLDSSDGTLEMNAPANLDNAELVGVHGVSRDAIIITGGAALGGTKFRARNIAFTVNSTLYSGSSSADFELHNCTVIGGAKETAVPFAIFSAPSFVHLTDASYVAGGGKPIFALGNSSSIQILATGQSTVGTRTVGLSTGASAAAATVYYDATDFLLANWSATGITTYAFPQGDSGNLPYSPATPANWSGSPPATTAAAIDRLAAAVQTLRGSAIP
jgi:hypothetical protein